MVEWNAGPPKPGVDEHAWYACTTEAGGRYCCFSDRGRLFRECPVAPWLPVPVDAEMLASTVGHFRIPEPGTMVC